MIANLCWRTLLLAFVLSTPVLAAETKAVMQNDALQPEDAKRMIVEQWMSLHPGVCDGARDLRPDDGVAVCTVKDVSEEMVNRFWRGQDVFAKKTD